MDSGDAEDSRECIASEASKDAEVQGELSWSLMFLDTKEKSSATQQLE